MMKFFLFVSQKVLDWAPILFNIYMNDLIILLRLFSDAVFFPLITSSSKVIVKIK